MKSLLTIVGARPHFVKAAVLSPRLRPHFNEIILHTGQHYDDKMSDIFFRELEIAPPTIQIPSLTGTFAQQFSRMLEGIEKAVLETSPDAVMVYGDTNSTLAGAIISNKCGVPVIHIEGGLRDFDPSIPEEINRIIIDRLSKYIFAPSAIAVSNLEREGIRDGVYIVGDLLIDAVTNFKSRSVAESAILQKYTLSQSEYFLATVHRVSNVDDESRFKLILDYLSRLERSVILPVHPRTHKNVLKWNVSIPQNIKLIDPIGYLDMIQLMHNAAAVLTDSGGIQKEAYALAVPCFTMLDSTPWVETVESGWNTKVGSQLTGPAPSLSQISKIRSLKRPPFYGGGDASQKIVEILRRQI